MGMKFITDNGGPLSLRDESGNTLVEIPRYGVWGQTARGKPQVIECHNDLALLQATHAVPNERVVVIQPRSGRITRA